MGHRARPLVYARAVSLNAVVAQRHAKPVHAAQWRTLFVAAYKGPALPKGRLLYAYDEGIMAL